MTLSTPRYYTDMTCYELVTTILTVEHRDGLVVLTLEDTIFHPQGGGQPTDRGTIEGSQGIIKITQVKKREDGLIEHLGTLIEGALAPSERVTCRIDQAVRILHSRIHSAGHLLDVVLKKLALHWEPSKGYHFVEGPYVEYLTNESPGTQLTPDIENLATQLIQENIPTWIELQGTKRIVHIADNAVPCGGTHVASTGEIQQLKIRNIKQKQGTIRISYSVGE